MHEPFYFDHGFANANRLPGIEAHFPHPFDRPPFDLCAIGTSEVLDPVIAIHNRNPRMRPRDAQIGAQINVHVHPVSRTPEHYGFDQSIEDFLVTPATVADTHELPSAYGAKIAQRAEHLSVYQTSPKLWEREAFEEKLDGAPEATGEPGKFSAGELGRLTVRVFFSAGAGLLAWSHMPVETAQ